MSSAGLEGTPGQVMWIARHGYRADFEDPDWKRNADRPDDPPLSESGIAQAWELAERLRGEGIAHVFASPFIRAVQTASHVARALDLPVCIEHGLTEWLKWDWFAPDGPHYLPMEEMKRRFPRVDPHYRSVWQPTYPEGDDEMIARVKLAATLLARKHPQDILLVGHAATVMGVCLGMVEPPVEGVTAPCCSITKLVRRGAGWQVELQGDRSHLSEPRGNDRFS